MGGNNKQSLTPEQQQYQDLAQKYELQRPVFKNCIRAFFIGGLISLIGQLLMTFFMTYFDFTEKTAGDPTIAVLIFLSALLTGLGVYDRMAQYAGAGTAVPVTGFANSIASAAIEHRTEGYVLGVGSNMFKVAGSVIVFGTFAAFIIGIIHTLVTGGVGH
ncbi:stage V sporulation protein AC [Halalkalibacterium halodurans]|jgi:stage V sporulation protein AC|uniref:Stage V sporulation protein AC n=2 Tax=Halalkalibacterium halodurans TaxID=86665 RepID=Q9KCK3_HALH5|nr:stage V sporulation protein AC [Halalkalibacterium halodurans]MDY7222140.1 stage V sporulation protein AC [Halalkalibacterium halodurans]MDY7241361.1 stage V sporulation protein AC [Halalkalibacterium halodurans]MED3646794.1 stage V sporulation protein AC [Halalkalibacterium halodurans]MED4162908.1 stage V sporulation protein AC [Halalkalibacterium halodurans]MED4173008.1 stage V sporulation protein AC [Halalkalibacterium halodurans]